MDQRERLIELLEAESGFSRYMTDDERRAKLADYLLANSVIVPPVKVGDTVYGLAQPCGGCKAYNEVMTEEYLKMCQQCDRYEIIEIAFDYELIPEWGKTVFLTKAEAENALAERSNR